MKTIFAALLLIIASNAHANGARPDCRGRDVRDARLQAIFAEDNGVLEVSLRVTNNNKLKPVQDKVVCKSNPSLGEDVSTCELKKIGYTVNVYPSNDMKVVAVLPTNSSEIPARLTCN